jgi:hypothetical protein
MGFLIELDEFSGCEHSFNQLPVLLVTAGTPMNIFRPG